MYCIAADGTVYTSTEEAGINFEEENTEFTLYYEYDGDSTPLYANIWQHAGVEFGDDAATSSDWGWDNPQAEFETVETDTDWHYTTFKILSADEHDGITVYAGDSSTTLGEYDDQWNNTAIYAQLVSGESDVYCIGADGTVYTSTEEAGINFEEPQIIREFEFDTDPVEGGPVDSELFVEPVEGLMKGFITGADISSYASIIASHATYKDAEGHILDDAGFFNLLKSSGVNYVRIRAWVDPYDENGKGYGGGNCDVETATYIGKLATDAGLRVLIDFHYSDFWTDPGKQNAPKAWKNLSLEDKAATLKQWTIDSLTAIIDGGVDVGMVQLGNETTTGFCGEKNIDKMCVLFAAASEGVQAVEEAENTKIMMAIHLTNPENKGFNSFAKSLNDNGVVYDVFATSYYPYWHGTLENLTSELSTVARNYGKYVMVAETSYVRTLEDGDGHPNTVREGNNDKDLPYVVSEQGQALHIRNVVQAVADVPDNKGIGVFWWEPAWIPVENWADADDKDAVLESNKAKWEENGSGWASSYGGEYDAAAAEWFGGSAVDNESWFDFDGKAVESIKVFDMARYGTTAEDYLIEVSDTEYSFVDGEECEMPETVEALYASGEIYDVEVVWDEEVLEAAIAEGPGEYEIPGTVTYNEEEYDVICVLTIEQPNLLVNPSFEEGTRATDWPITGTGADYTERNMANNIKTGSWGLHFWSNSAFGFMVSQNVTLDRGVYKYGGYLQGDKDGDDDIYEVFVKSGETTIDEDSKTLDGWNKWVNPEISEIVVTEDDTELTFGIYVKGSAEAWGMFDDMYLYKTADLFTVTFDNNGYGEAPDSVDVIAGEKVKQPDDLAQVEADGDVDVEFIGWFTTDDCTEEFDFDTEIDEDTIIYAGWQQYFTVTPDENGHGTAPDPQRVKAGEKAEEPDALEADEADYVRFTGWFKDADCTEEFDFDDDIDENTTIYAGWEHAHRFNHEVRKDATCTEKGYEEYWVCTDPNCGKMYSDADGVNKIEKPVEIPSKGHDWTKVKYVWSKDYSTCTASRLCRNDHAHDQIETVASTFERVDPTDTEEGSITYTAVFENPAFGTRTKVIGICTVSFDNGGYGVEPESQNIKVGDKAEEPDALVAGEDDYVVFTGWYKDADCTELFDFDEAIVDDVLIYAGWEHAHGLRHEEKKEATCTEDGYEEYWVCKDPDCGKMFSDADGENEIEKPVVIASEGHDWTDVTYDWAEDYSSCTASRLCNNDHEHDQSETVNTTSETVEPTATEKGSVTYTATFKNSDFGTDTKVVELDPLGTAEYEFEETSQELNWKPGDGDMTLVAHCGVGADDKDTFIHFLRAKLGKKVPGKTTVFKTLTKEQYKAESGSLRLTLYESFLKTLTPGEYILRAEFDDGYVDTTFTIEAEEDIEPIDDEPTEATTEDTTEATTEATSTEETTSEDTTTEEITTEEVTTEATTSSEETVSTEATTKDDAKAAQDASVEENTTSGNTTNEPKTADETPVAAMMLTLLISAAGLTYILGLKRKKER